MFGLRAVRDNDGPPEILVVVRPFYTAGQSLLGWLADQRDATPTPGRSVVQCRPREVAGVECGFVEVIDEREQRRDVSYVRAVAGWQLVAGFRLAIGQRGRRTLDAAAREVIASAELQAPPFDPDAADATGRVSIYTSGFSIKLPAKWERQDLFGQVIVYAPGTGFRARINFTANSDDETDWESPDEPIEGMRTALPLLNDRVRLQKPKRIMVAGQRGWRLDWRGVLKRNELPVRGIQIAVPHNGRGAAIAYTAATADFPRHEPVLLRMLKSIRWPKKAR
ncbi:MAG: hypothetical protein K2Y37_09760 [Pirellulales bacterium]|nr:hypothetical protein [Pirellulales bacterium]